MEVINREDAIKALQNNEPVSWHDDPYEIGAKNQWELDISALEIVPFGENKGRWIKGAETKAIKRNKYLILPDAFYCSECENEAYWDTDYGQQLFDYCPCCGARMVKDE